MNGSQSQTSGGALEGLRVLDLAGPMGVYCGKLLADLGADVIRVEPGRDLKWGNAILASRARPTPASGAGAADRAASTAPKSLTIGVWSTVPGMSLVTNTSPVGGGYRIGEIQR